nr:putative reverse transcriptase domain-containing protein [Tanacetum cinerariifolium]
MLPIQSPATIKPPSTTTNNHHRNWWAPLFGWSSELPDYIDSTFPARGDVMGDEKANNDRKAVRRCDSVVNFSDEKAKKLRMMTAETMSFHDKMYHSAIASRLASDFSDRQTYEFTNIIVGVFEYHFQIWTSMWAIGVVRDLGFGYDLGRHSRLFEAEVGEGQLIEPELVQETTEKILYQKSYTDKRRKPLEFSVGDYVLLKVSSWKGVICFGKKEKLAPRFVGPFEIVEKKCLADPTLQVHLDEIRVDAKLNFVEELVEILEREFKKLKRSRIAIVKIWTPMWAIGILRDLGFGCDLGHHSRLFEVDGLLNT